MWNRPSLAGERGLLLEAIPEESTSGICHLVANSQSVKHLVTNTNVYVKRCNMWRCIIFLKGGEGWLIILVAYTVCI